MRVPFGTVPVGGRFRVVNQDTNYVHPVPACKVTPGTRGPLRFNAVQNSDRPHGRRLFHTWLEDDQMVDVDDP